MTPASELTSKGRHISSTVACWSALAILALSSTSSVHAESPAVPNSSIAWNRANEVVARAANLARNQWTNVKRFINQSAVPWMRAADPIERVAGGGLVASAALALITTLDRLRATRRSRVIPTAFRRRFLNRFAAGQLDWSQAVDYCELNPSPACAVALAALRQSGKLLSAAPDHTLIRARSTQIRKLRQNADTLRRIALIAPMIGILGSLATASRILGQISPDNPIRPLIPFMLTHFCAAIGLAIVALVAYDILMIRIERIASDLDEVGSLVMEGMALDAAGLAASPAPQRPHQPQTHRPHAVTARVDPTARYEPRSA